MKVLLTNVVTGRLRDTMDTTEKEHIKSSTEGLTCTYVFSNECNDLMSIMFWL